MTLTIKDIKKEYWELVYKIVDPFRKEGDEPLEEFIVYMNEESFEGIEHFFESKIKDILKSVELEDKRSRAVSKTSNTSWSEESCGIWNLAVQEQKKLHERILNE